jgi:deleted-in-malignant-brain-tumors protein 1
VWGTICGNHWTTEDAKVACKMLGLPTTYAKAYHDGFFGQGEGPIFLSRVHCRGNEQNLTSCWHSLEVDCIHSQDAGVSCLSSAECNVQGQMRLVNGTAPSNGRLEVCYNGLWGTVSQDRWDVYSVRIICSILGYNMSGLVRYNAYYGRGSGPVHLDNVFCYGGETNILQCSHSLNASEDTHNKDVGIECIIPINCTHGEVRLVDGDRPSEGRLEVCLQGSWGSVSHYGWNRQAAKVVCRQLGYSTKGSAVRI